jgi:formylglycine-generating enzyme required for sulfatase activity
VSGRWQEGPSEVLGETPIEAKAISPGSIVLLFSFSGRESVRLPVLLRRGEAAKIVVDLPYPTEVPDNFVLVPAGKFLYGTAGGEEARNFYGSQPMHEIATKSYLIAREETTYADWIEFLRSLPKGERANLAPDGRRQGIRIALTEVSDGDFRIALGPEDNPQTGSAGQLIHYRGRAGFPAQNWARMPVSGITFNDALAYTDWLHRTGRVRGARACTEHEWERAARGADGRAYPHGEEIKPNEANYDLTYGRAFTAFGPDEVGSHRASDSPFGVQDLAGNVWEWTAFMDDPRIPVARGGSFFQSDTITRPENRAQDLPTRRDAFYGFRVCATYPAP